MLDSDFFRGTYEWVWEEGQGYGDGADHGDGSTEGEGTGDSFYTLFGATGATAWLHRRAGRYLRALYRDGDRDKVLFKMPVLPSHLE